ncbi:hypothetical protein V490_07279 [Pseudogymnoascus sp. VKM F-3557]|nr:hypothetical protein V490_07279 [Pseudogymnoascus sp. VKM F-3557]
MDLSAPGGANSGADINGNAASRDTIHTSGQANGVFSDGASDSGQDSTVDGQNSQASDSVTQVAESEYSVTGTVGNQRDITLQGVIYRSLATIQIPARGIEVAGAGLGDEAATVVRVSSAISPQGSVQIIERGFQRPLAAGPTMDGEWDVYSKHSVATRVDWNLAV